jgi:uncharacterized peroxidase-related enzyme
MENTVMKQQESALIFPKAPAGEEDRVNAIFSNIEQQVGFVPDGLRLYSLSPPLLETFVGNVGYFSMGGTSLSPALTAMIRYQVSWDSGCSFCVDMNETFLVNQGFDLETIRQTRDNPDASPLEDKEKLLLKIAVKAVEDPDDVTRDDIEAAHAAGWSDREIFDAVAQAAGNRAFNYILRTFNIEHQGAFS